MCPVLSLHRRIERHTSSADLRADWYNHIIPQMTAQDFTPPERLDVADEYNLKLERLLFWEGCEAAGC